MSRINVVDPSRANPEQAELFTAITSALGTVPNFLKVFANSPAALKAFLGLHGIAGEGTFQHHDTFLGMDTFHKSSLSSSFCSTRVVSSARACF